MANHHWSETDDIVALYVYRLGMKQLGTTVTDLALARGIKPDSFGKRVKNFSGARRERRTPTLGKAVAAYL